MYGKEELGDSPEDVTELGYHSRLFKGSPQLNCGGLDPLTVRLQQLGENGLHD